MRNDIYLVIEYGNGDNRRILYATESLKQAYDDSMKLNDYSIIERKVFYSLQRLYKEHSSLFFSSIKKNQYTPQQIVDELYNSWEGVYREKIANLNISGYEKVLENNINQEWFITGTGPYIDRYYCTEHVTVVNDQIDPIELYHSRIF